MEDLRHPSQVQISFSRINSNKAIAFYGSDIKCSSWIQLRIKTSRKRRDLSNDWFFADQTILELRLSPNQFSELLTTMNCGEGVPATLTFHNNEIVPQGEIEDPIEENKQEIFEKEIDLVGKETLEAIKDLETTISGLKLTKKEKEIVSSKFTLLRNRIVSHLPFLLSQAKEQVAHTVAAGKAVIDNFYTGIITRLGLKALQEKPEVKMIDKGNKENGEKNEIQGRKKESD